MIASQNQRGDTFLEGLQHHAGNPFAGFADLLDVFCVRLAGVSGLSNRHRDIAPVAYHMTQRLEPGFEAGYPDRGRPHIDAAARLAQIEGHAENADMARRKGLHSTRTRPLD